MLKNVIKKYIFKLIYNENFISFTFFNCLFIKHDEFNGNIV